MCSGSASRTSAAAPAALDRRARKAGESLPSVVLRLVPPVLSDDEIRNILGPLGRHSRVALAVSGGSDSTALMVLAREWGARQPSAPDLIILTVDHGLRIDSRRDAEWVSQRAAALGLACRILTWRDPRPRASQAAARQARYDLLSGFARDHGVGAIVTAHTRDDVAETFLMRLARGSGVDGLAAMEPESAWNGVPLLRPLLGVTRSQLRAELEARGADWLEDPSNADPHFERVRIRTALPVLAGLGITPARIAESAMRLRRARDAIDAAAAHFITRHVTADPGGYLRADSIALNHLPQEVTISALKQMLRAVGGQPRAPRLRKIEMLAGHLRHVSRVAMTLGGCVLARAGGDELLTICREPGRLRAAPVALSSDRSAVWDRRFRICAGRLRAGALTVNALGEANLAALPDVVRREHPRAALVTLPALYDGGACLGVPIAGYALADQHPDAAACRAEFLWPPASGAG